MEKIEIKEAMDRLKKGEVLKSIIDNTVTYFVFKNTRYFIQGNNMGLKLNEDKFAEIYASTIFENCEDNGTFIDPLKDEEYYSWRNK